MKSLDAKVEQLKHQGGTEGLVSGRRKNKTS